MQRVSPELTYNARSLRREATPAERALWPALGDHHGDQTDQGAERTDCLERRVRVGLRCWNTEVLENLEGVMVAITLAVSRASTHPRPLPEREGR